MITQTPDAQLIYIYDPMCSWCYAFTASLQALRKQLPESVGFQAVLGGLAPDSQVPMPLEMQQAIAQNWRRIEATVPGVSFNFDFWRLNTPIRATYPACRAVLAAKSQGQTYEWPMVEAIQQAYYQQAKNPALPEILTECAAAIGLDSEQFGRDLVSQATQRALQADIDKARVLGVNSYPSLRLIQGGQSLTWIIAAHKICWLSFSLSENNESCSGPS